MHEAPKQSGFAESEDKKDRIEGESGDQAGGPTMYTEVPVEPDFPF